MNASAPLLDTSGLVARSVRIKGLVQGIGFRPFLHRLAVHHDILGYVRNESGGVVLRIEGRPENVESFLHQLRSGAPPLARLDTIDIEPCRVAGLVGFSIVPSVVDRAQRLPVAPDVALCAECRDELWDSANRRYQYPFITCTNCGPRYTVIEAMPYDRERTMMRAFDLCDPCRREFENPESRRHHSQTNSCSTCGPQLQFLADRGSSTSDGNTEAIEAAATLLENGQILALKGLGGFHLAVDATNETAVIRLRARKHRDAKPLAIMAYDLEAAGRLAQIGVTERRLLESPEHPVVLLERTEHSRLAPSVAPGLTTVGIMLPYTPLHELLLARLARPLVMTSGNVSDEPIAIANDEASVRLRQIADGFLIHDRDIVARYDDSVVRVVNERPLFVRRARGYAPLPITLPVSAPRPLIAVGPHLKNTLTLASENAAYVSQHIGDLENVETLEHFYTTYDTFCRLFNTRPSVAVRDRHPGYLSTRIAQELDLDEVLTVQHHHAHVAAVAAEHDVVEPVIGLAFDGTGLGDDGCIWGGEVLVADLTSYRRVAHLTYVPLPGGDVAARAPWRSAIAHLSTVPEALDAFPLMTAGVNPAEIETVRRQMALSINTVPTSSMGRLFDAAAAVLGIRRLAMYEGQAAMELEAAAGHIPAKPIPLSIAGDGAVWTMDPTQLLVRLAERFTAGASVGLLAAQFHESIAAAAAEITRLIRDEYHINRVALSGGVFQNARLLSSTEERLRALGFEVLVPLQLSPNDSAISYGQAVVGAALLSMRRSALCA